MPQKPNPPKPTCGTVLLDHAGGRLVMERDPASAAVLRRYVYGPDEAPVAWYEGAGTSDRRWLLPDERGSVIAVTDGAGNAIRINSYDDYGIPASTNLGRFQYTGQKWLPTLGLYDYKARLYSPTLGRFLQTDPIGYGDGPNWYNYVHSDPVNNIDPWGLAVTVCGVARSLRLQAPYTYPTILAAIAREKAVKAWQRAWKAAPIDAADPEWRDVSADLVGAA